MAEVAEKMEELTVPDGGIGDFVMEDDELEEVYGEQASDYGDSGIAQFPALAERMAKYGRNEDNMLAHVAEGELVIPRQFLEDDVMKQRIYEVLADAGVEDPEAYIVGSESNDINPTTGLPEFFLKKLFKSIGKAIKKVVKTVVKVVKKIAPIVLPIALAFTPLGAVYGAALGSGIGTLINGGSIKDALKSALISGAIGGVTAGFTGNTGEGFFANVKAELANPGARLSQTANAFTEGVKSGSVSGFGEQFFSDFVPTPGAEVDAAANAAAETGAQTTQQAAEQTAQQTAEQTAQTAAQETAAQTAADGAIKTVEAYQPPGFFESVKKAVTPNDGVGFFEGMGDAFFPGGPTAEQVAQAQGQKFAATQQALLAEGVPAATAQSLATEAAKSVTASSLAPGLLRSYGPLAAAGTLAAGATGMFEVPEPEQASFIDYNEDGTPVTGADLIAQDPARFLIGDLGSRVLNPETGEYEDREDEIEITPVDTTPYIVPTQYPLTRPTGGGVTGNAAGYLLASNPGGPFARPPVGAAEGGAIGQEVFPRRTGGIAPTEGVPGEDSVRAMLMPGEFVMTTDAVRGLGNGNLNKGIKNMYSVMRNLESRGRAMA